MSYNFTSTDAELLSSIKEGNMDAFKVLYNRYWDLLYISAFKVLKDDEDAKDIVQEVFVSILRKSSSIDIQTSLSNYLYSAVRYKVIDHINRSKTRINYVQSLTNHINSGACITDHTILEREINTHLQQEIQKLPEKMKEVFELSREGDLSHKEIAMKLNISDKTVKKQISNAIKLLKPKFTGYYMVLITFLFN